MHEGRNIHFSPVDNKPLCSYSNKLCRQRRLNGYAFCIRHILEDKSAPFKQCRFVTRNNCQKCLNAIPTNQERGYCHSHMQVAGIIPKTERKSKLSSNSLTSAHSPVSGNVMLKKATISTTNPVRSGDCVVIADAATVSKEAIYDYEDDSQPSPPPALILKGKVSSVSVCNDKVATSFRESFVSLKDTKVFADGNIVKKSDSSNKSSTESSENWNANHNTNSCPSNSVDNDRASQTVIGTGDNKKSVVVNCNTDKKSPLDRKTEITSIKSSSPKMAESQPSLSNAPLVRDKWRTFKFDNISIIKEDKLKPLHQYKQMKTFKILEKLPLFSDVPLFPHHSNSSPSKEAKFSSLEINSASSVSSALRIPLTKTISCNYGNSIKKSAALEILMTPPFLNLSMNKYVQKLSNEYNEEDKSYEMFIGRENGVSLDEITIKKRESRQQFLCRVRKAFKSQYKTIKRASKVSEKHEKRDKRAFRNSLLTCVLNNPRFCAQVLVQGNLEQCGNHGISNNHVTIATSLVNHLQNVSSKKLIISEMKSENTSVVSAKLTNTLSRNRNNKKDSKTKILSTPHNDSEVDSDCKPIMKLIDIDNKSSIAEKVDNTNSIFKGLGTSKAKVCDSTGVQRLESGRDTKKPKIRSNGSGIAISTSKIEAVDSPDDGVESGRWDIQEEHSGIKCASNNKTVSSSLLSGILRNAPLTTSFRKRKNNNSGSVDTFIENGSHGAVVKTEIEDPWDPATTEASNNSVLSNHSQNVNSFQINRNIKNLIHNHVNEHCSTVNQKSEPQTRMELNHSQLIMCPKGSTATDIVLETAATSKGMVSDSSVGPSFEHSASSHRNDCDFSDEDLDQNFELQLDPEIAQQASRLLEENELTEDDFNELFPETRLGDQKLVRQDLSDLGIDFASNIDTNDVDYSLFANIFPNVTRSIQQSSVFVNNQF